MLSAVQRDEAVREADREAQKHSEFGDAIELGFRLPEGREITCKFRVGHSIQYVKAVLHHDHSIPQTAVLSCKERRLIDPLSISDCPTIIPGQLNIIDIKVQ